MTYGCRPSVLLRLISPTRLSSTAEVEKQYDSQHRACYLLYIFGSHASISRFSLEISFSLQSVWCCISPHPRDERLHADCLACLLVFTTSTELLAVIDGFSMLFRTCLDNEESIIVSTHKARFVHSTPLDHRLRCLRKYHHSRHRRAHQLRYGATAIH